jgi:hypothetical protein
VCESCDVSLTIVSTLQTRTAIRGPAAAVAGGVTGALAAAATAAAAKHLSGKRDLPPGGFPIAN